MGAAFDIEGGVTTKGMMAWIKEMRKQHPEWTYVHVPQAADPPVRYDPKSGSPDFVACAALQITLWTRGAPPCLHVRRLLTLLARARQPNDVLWQLEFIPHDGHLGRCWRRHTQSWGRRVADRAEASPGGRMAGLKNDPDLPVLRCSPHRHHRRQGDQDT